MTAFVLHVVWLRLCTCCLLCCCCPPLWFAVVLRGLCVVCVVSMCCVCCVMCCVLYVFCACYRCFACAIVPYVLCDCAFYVWMCMLLLLNNDMCLRVACSLCFASPVFCVFCILCMLCVLLVRSGLLCLALFC